MALSNCTNKKIGYLWPFHRMKCEIVDYAKRCEWTIYTEPWLLLSQLFMAHCSLSLCSPLYALSPTPHFPVKVIAFALTFFNPTKVIPRLSFVVSFLFKRLQSIWLAPLEMSEHLEIDDPYFRNLLPLIHMSYAFCNKLSSLHICVCMVWHAFSVRRCSQYQWLQFMIVLYDVL